MRKAVSRLLLAGTGSGCGKTTVTCAILQALVGRGLRVKAMKCGPDYIDPMLHSRITGREGTNLDPFFFSPNTLRLLLARGGEGSDVCVIEGVMGYYDGLSPAKTAASSYEAARITKTPAVLVVDAKGASGSLLAVIEGFVRFCPDSQIRGVILNRCSGMVYPALQRAIRERFEGRIQPLGYLPQMDFAFQSRHLGLVVQEDEGFREKLCALGGQAERTLDLTGLLQLAKTAEPVDYEPLPLPQYRPVCIAVARDAAFSFYYADSLQMLRQMGAQLLFFSPLADSKLPEEIDGLYLGGGYPELYARQLSENVPMRQAVYAALYRGLPCIAECGGFMYLTGNIAGYPMAGFLPGECFDRGKLTRFGYLHLRAKTDNLLCRAGEEIPGHEFHYWDATRPGDGFTAVKPSGKSRSCAVSTPRLYAGFPHFHFYANPLFAKNFYEACLKECAADGGMGKTGGY